jgi:hypothetical protein
VKGSSAIDQIFLCRKCFVNVVSVSLCHVNVVKGKIKTSFILD